MIHLLNSPHSLHTKQWTMNTVSSDWFWTHRRNKKLSDHYATVATSSFHKQSETGHFIKETQNQEKLSPISSLV